MKTVTYWIFEIEKSEFVKALGCYEEMYEGEIEVEEGAKPREIAQMAAQDAAEHYAPYRNDAYDIAWAKIDVEDVGEFWLDEFGVQ